MGDSMAPIIESGTLVVVQPEEQYFPGDIVAFVNEDGLNVVHRLVEQTDEGFVTKGDNNPRRDKNIVTFDDVVGRALFVVPYLGFTSLFLHTPLGMSIFGIWAIVMLVPRKSGKNKIKGHESFTIFKVALVTTIANYVMTQIALGININASNIINIPLTNFLEPSMASTVSFTMLTMIILVLYFITLNIDSGKTKRTSPIKLIFTLGGVMILVVQLMSIINLLPFFINLIEEQGLLPNPF